MAALIHVGISSCLLGQKVRYDGGDKRAPFLLDTLGRFVEWVPVCPEFEMGLGVPREPIRLVPAADTPAPGTLRSVPGAEVQSVRAIGQDSGVDYTAAMQAYARRRVDELAALDLRGYIFKKGSPSCGLWQVKVWNREGVAAEIGRGLFAAALVERFPHLPVEDEDRLSDPGLREAFIERVLASADSRG